MEKILLVEDEPAHIELVRRAFDSRGRQFHLDVVHTIEEARRILEESDHTLVIADWLLPDGEGMELVTLAGQTCSKPVILMTSHGNERIAVDAMKAGVLDYVVKSDTTLADMPHICERALREWDNQVQRLHAEDELRLRVIELEAVNRLSTILRTSDMMDDMLAKVLDEVLETLNIKHGGIWLIHPVDGSLRQEQARGWLTQMDLPSNQQNDGLFGCIHSAELVFISDEFFVDERIPQNIRANMPPGYGGVCQPIKMTNEMIGIILLSVELPRKISATEAHLLNTVSEIVGTSIHRLRLHNHTQRSLQRMAALRAIDLAITSTFELQLSLDILLNQAVNHLGVDAANILRLDPYTQKLSIFTTKGYQIPPNLILSVNQNRNFPWEAVIRRRMVSYPDLSLVQQPLPEHFTTAGQSFQAYHAVPLVAKGQVKGVLELFHHRIFRPDGEWLDFLEALGSQAALAMDNSELFDNLQRSNQELRIAYDATIEGWSRALDLRDRETEGHTQRVVDMTLRLSQMMGIGEEDLVHIRRGALLHDIGKMGIPDQILLKTGPLAEVEWKIMRQHPNYAYEMLAPIPYLRQALEIPYCHHEHWNGQGYPRGLVAEQIPLSARIFAIIDVWDALNSDRPYRKAWGEALVREYIQDHTGKQFDPQVVGHFLRLLDS